MEELKKGEFEMVSLLLPLLLRLLTCASVGGEAQDRPPADGLEKTTSGEGLEGPGATGIFLQTNSSRHLAMVGTTAVLHCHTGDIGESVVSWIRRRDYHLLTVGQHAYSSDERFQVRYVKQDNDWQLHLRYVQVRDAGEYECQVSSHPATSLFSTLKVVEPTAEILGGPEKYIRRGSSLRLVCLLRHYETPPDYVFWYNGERKMINYDQQVTVETNSTCSVLTIQDVQFSDNGRYACHPANAQPASILIHVLNGGETPAAIHSPAARAAHPCLPLLLLLLLLLRLANLSHQVVVVRDAQHRIRRMRTYRQEPLSPCREICPSV